MEKNALLFSESDRWGIIGRRRLPFTVLFLVISPAFLLWNADINTITTSFTATGNLLRQNNYFISVINISSSSPSPSPPPLSSPSAPKWVSVELGENYTSNLISRWLGGGGKQCRDSRTTDISVVGLDLEERSGSIELAADEMHEFVFDALDGSGKRRCLGGDYFETDLSGGSWKSRPPVKDHGNGTYSVYIQVHRDFVGTHNLTVVLLFRSFEGLKFSPARFKYRKKVRNIVIKFSYNTTNAPLPLPEIHRCRAVDFDQQVWSGRWTRHAENDECEISDDGRYRCIDSDLPCKAPWCQGSLGWLESNGWVYSAHCSFRIYSEDEAWKLLRGRWLFFWGDSNHVDTIRNLLNFVLGRWDIKSVPRRFDERYSNPKNSSESVRITSIFNGHWNQTMNYLGLESLENKSFRDLLMTYFSEEKLPDTMVLNSGLHDGIRWQSVRRFKLAAEYCSAFWETVIREWRHKGKRLPSIFYRTTIATGGYARDLAYNPSKMEVFNNILVEKLTEKGILVGGGVIDDFDMTFPWHYDNRCNDGVHYGRAPLKAQWRDGQIGHQYFVDLMLSQVLLNGVDAGARRR